MKYVLLFSFIFLTACLPVKAQEKVLNIEEVTSDKGIQAWLVEDHTLPIIAVRFAFKNAGAIQNDINKQGVARLLSNTMDEGAGDLTSQDFQKQLTDHSITLYFNSGRDNFGGQLKTLSRNKEKAFELLKLSLTKPRFDAEPLERMREANLSRIRSSMGDPEWINARLFNDIAFKGHPYALNSGGTLTSLKNITAQDLKNHKKNWLTRDRLTIGVAGDITKKELSNILDDVFSGLPEKGKENTIKHFDLQNIGNSFLYKKEIPQTIIASALPSFNEKDPDYYALRVMNYIYGGGGFGSRLMEEAREKRGLTYGIYSSVSNQDYLNSIDISTSTKNESTQEIMAIISQEMDTLKTQKVTDQELEDAKSYITGSMPLALTSTDKVANILLSLQLNDRPIDYLDKFSDHINSVTADDIQRVAKRVLSPEKLITIMVGQPQNMNNIKEIEKLPNVE